ncbi:MAG: glyoxalase [Lachnospiraceae bacterium]
MYDKECLEVFLREQGKLFDEPVAENLQEAEEFLSDCMAEVFDSIDEVRQYFRDNMDISDISDEELTEQLEVFKLSKGRYLIVEG